MNLITTVRTQAFIINLMVLQFFNHPLYRIVFSRRYMNAWHAVISNNRNENDLFLFHWCPRWRTLRHATNRPGRFHLITATLSVSLYFPSIINYRSLVAPVTPSTLKHFLQTHFPSYIALMHGWVTKCVALSWIFNEVGYPNPNAEKDIRDENFLQFSFLFFLVS